MARTLVSYPEPDPKLKDPHAERRVIGALLLSPAVAEHALAVLDDTAFTDDHHRAIFQAAAAVHARGLRPDALNVGAELVRHNAGGPLPAAADLHGLVAQAPPEQLAPYYTAIVRDLAALRSKPSSGPAEGLSPPAAPTPEGMPPAPMRGFLIDEDT